MKNFILALALTASSSAFAFLGFPPPEEMNAVTIEKVRAEIIRKGKIGSRFSIQTIRMNNRYEVRAPNGCEYSATVMWGEFGWPYMNGVRLKSLNCD